jgi:hypothetical protein
LALDDDWSEFYETPDDHPMHLLGARGTCWSQKVIRSSFFLLVNILLMLRMAQSAMFSAMGAMPAKLLRKEVLVSEGNERLRVVTLTFANPNGKSLGLKPHTHIQTQTYYHDVCKHPYI